jgi:hypothetical protein
MKLIILYKNKESLDNSYFDNINNELKKSITKKCFFLIYVYDIKFQFKLPLL